VGTQAEKSPRYAFLLIFFADELRGMG